MGKRCRTLQQQPAGIVPRKLTILTWSKCLEFRQELESASSSLIFVDENHNGRGRTRDKHPRVRLLKLQCHFFQNKWGSDEETLYKLHAGCARDKSVGRMGACFICRQAAQDVTTIRWVVFGTTPCAWTRSSVVVTLILKVKAFTFN